MSTKALQREVEQLAREARRASHAMAAATAAQKNAWLKHAAERLQAARAKILEANRQDLAAAQKHGLPKPMQRRLALDEKTWESMLHGLHEVAALPDPLQQNEAGEKTLHTRPNGLRVGRMRIPLGVIAIVYEARPNVTVDAAALCLKAGNAVILRGGSEAFRSNTALAEALREALGDAGLPEAALTLLPTAERAAVDHLLKLDEYIDLLIPRGGKELVRKVKSEGSIPVVAHDEGVCHLFVDESADANMAAAIAFDSKIKQMAVCNGLETLLCHAAAAKTGALQLVLQKLHQAGVALRGCAQTREVFAAAAPANESDWHAEYLDKVLAVRVVPNLNAAIAHVQQYGSNHTDMIVTQNKANAREWLRRVDSGTVGVNCSTAFADGQRLGLGAEIGISTTKVHSFGPMGLEDLTARKFVLYGDGQLRE